MPSQWLGFPSRWGRVTIECQHVGLGPVLDVLHVEDDIHSVVSLQEQHLVFPLICTEIQLSTPSALALGQPLASATSAVGLM